MKLKIIAFDGEMLPQNNQMPDPEKCPIMLLSFAANYNIMNDKKKVIFVLNRDKSFPEGVQIRDSDVIVRFNDERRMIHGWELLMKDCDVIAGYNTSGFDIPYIIDRAKALNMSKLMIGNADDTLWYKKHDSKGKNVTVIGGIKGKIVEDVLYILRRDDASNTIKADYNLKNLKLEVTAKEILKKEKKDFSIQEMIDYWEKGLNEEKFINYCSVDSELALEFITKFRLLDKFIGLSRRAGKVPQDIIDSQGFGSLVENLLMKELGKNGRVVPCRGKSHTNIGDDVGDDNELKGAFVKEPKVGISDNVVIADYASLYPSLIIKHNMCYSTVILDNSIPDDPETMNIVRDEDGKLLGRFVKSHILKGIVTSILESLTTERKTAKAEMKKCEKGSSIYLTWDSEQNATKILMNSFFGYTGEQGAKLYCFQVASSITGSGQKQIKYTMKMIDDIIVTDIDEKQYKLKIIMGDSVTKDIPVLFFENNNGLLKANILPISELYDYYYGNGKYNTLSKYMEDKKNIYVEGGSGLVLLKGVHKHKVSKKGYKISTCCGLTKVTEDHSLFRYGKEIKPTDISIGSYIDTTNIYNIVNDDIKLVEGLKKNDADLAWVLGLFVADGYCNCTCGDKWGTKCVWNISQKDEKVLEKCKIILDKYYKGKYQFKIIDILESSNVHRLDAKGDVVSIVKEYRNYFYTDDEYGYKKLPEFILNSDKECIKAFLEGYYLGDGYINETKNQEFTTNSLILFKGLEFLNVRLKNRISRIKIDNRIMMKVNKKNCICKNRKEAYNGVVKNILDKHSYTENRNEVRHISQFDIKDEDVYDLTTDDETFVCGIGNILHHNTDSIYVQVIPLNTLNSILNREISVRVVSKELEKINMTLEKPMKLVFEDYAKRVLVTAKKRYTKIIVDEKGKETVSSKGIETIRREWSNFASESMEKAIDMILFEEKVDVGIRKMIDFAQNEAEKLKKGEIDIHKLMLSKQLSKPITAYDNEAVHVKVAILMKQRGRPSEVGDRIQFFIMDNGKKLISDKAEEANYVLSGQCKYKIDYDYYITKQLYPPIIRMLKVLGVSEQLLLKDKAQKSMMDF